MGWRGWRTSCLVAALAGVLTGAVYVAATGTFDLSKPAGAAALPAPSEQAASAAPIGGLAPPAVSSAASASHKTSTGSKADGRKAKKPKESKESKESKAAKTASTGEIEEGGGKKAVGKKPKGK